MTRPKKTDDPMLAVRAVRTQQADKPVYAFFMAGADLQRLPAEILIEHVSVLGGSQLRQDLWRGLTARDGMKLAGFQERAALRLSTATDDGGTIITAGTGSGMEC